MISSPCLSTTEHVVRLLSNPSSYGDGSESVERIETHLSYVFLSRTQAIKLKKPVSFEFVDFSTAEARRIACFEEV